MPRHRLPFDLLHPGILLLTTLMLALGVLAVSPAAAQVEGKQVEEETTPDVKGASQSEVLVVQVGDAVGDVTNLMPEDAPDLTSTSGNSASIFQDGSGNDAQIRQVGTNNEASASQLGSDNEIVITQADGAVRPVFEDDRAGDRSATRFFRAVRTFRPTGAGTGNRAVVVHNGMGNQTSITQLGSNNAAGIRLNGSGNAMNLLQTGDANRFLMDTAVQERDMNVLQNGSGNSLATDVPVNARMNGNGIELVIRRGGGTPLPLKSGE